MVGVLGAKVLDIYPSSRALLELNKQADVDDLIAEIDRQIHQHLAFGARGGGRVLRELLGVLHDEDAAQQGFEILSATAISAKEFSYFPVAIGHGEAKRCHAVVVRTIDLSVVSHQ